MDPKEDKSSIRRHLSPREVTGASMKCAVAKMESESISEILWTGWRYKDKGDGRASVRLLMGWN